MVSALVSALRAAFPTGIVQTHDKAMTNEKARDPSISYSSQGKRGSGLHPRWLLTHPCL
jgi:hypothetical protein